MARTLGTDQQMFFLVEYFLPLLLFGGSAALLTGGHPGFSVVASRIPLGVPFVLWGIFLLTVAEVNLADDFLEYRRFFKWQRVLYSEVQQARTSSYPGLGWITLDRFVSPWRRIYFVTLQPVFDRRVNLVA
jgi:hypothetical protein